MRGLGRESCEYSDCLNQADSRSNVKEVMLGLNSQDDRTVPGAGPVIKSAPSYAVMGLAQR